MQKSLCHRRLCHWDALSARRNNVGVSSTMSQTPIHKPWVLEGYAEASDKD
jgi:hypothetical protein